MPYNDVTNDCWILTAKTDLKVDGVAFESSQLPVKGSIPDGVCFRESIVLIGHRLFCGSFNAKSQHT